jgi:hypothetical protein
LRDAKYVQPQNNGGPVDKLHYYVILRKILQPAHKIICSGSRRSSSPFFVFLIYVADPNKIYLRKRLPGFGKECFGYT